MSKIISKLDLNKTPQLVDNNSLLFAKNIKVLKDGTIGPDNEFVNIFNQDSIQGKIVYTIVSTDNNLYFLVYDENNDDSKIIKYNELTGLTKEIFSAWKYNGGDVVGYATINNTNQTILTIAESKDNEYIPIKHINIDTCNENDNESFYTQTPDIPISNLYLIDTYSKTIPNGVYQFFVRYKIRENFYTTWFPCSKNCFAGTSQKINLSQGSIKYINIKKNSSKSFIFLVEQLNNDIANLYEEFQLGFVCSSDDTVVARSWKSFPMNTQNIYFDYNENDIKEINIDDLYNINYELFNVKNITYFRNKLYISNYTETDFNPNLEDYAKDVNIEFDTALINLGENIYTINGEILYGNNGKYTKFGSKEVKELITLGIIDSTYTQNNHANDVGNLYEIHFSIENGVFYIKQLINSIVGNFNNKLPIVNYDDNTWILNFFDYSTEGQDENTKYIIETNSEHHPLTKKFKGIWYVAAVKKNNGVAFKNDIQDSTFEIRLSYDYKDVYERYENENNFKFSEYVGTFICDYIKKYYPKYVLSRIYGYDDGNNLIDLFGNSNNTVYNSYIGITLVDNSKDTILQEVNKVLKDKISYINSDGTFYYNVNGTDVNISTVFIVYGEFSYSLEDCENVNFSAPNDGNSTCNVKVTKTNYTFTYTYGVANGNIIKIQDAVFKQYNTFLPFTNYNFYIHYVKQNGIATNGYYLKNLILTDVNISDKSILYPKINNVTIPDNYVAYFISCIKTKNIVCELFNVQSVNNIYTAYCLEADTLLYNINENITIVDNNFNIVTRKGKYYPSGTTEKLKYFSGCGCVEFSNDYNYIRYESIEITTNVSIDGSNDYLYFGLFKYESNKDLFFGIYTRIDAKDLTIDEVIEKLKNFVNNSNYDSLRREYVNFKNKVNISKTNDNKIKIQSLADDEVYAIVIAYMNLEFNFVDQRQFRNTFYNTPEYCVIARTESQTPVEPTNKKYYIVIDDINNITNTTQLIKLTPYLNKSEYDNYEDLNSPGYVCKVCKPDLDKMLEYYYSGSDIYKVNSTNNRIQLTDYEQYDSFKSTEISIIKSNFNLNYLSLTEDIVQKIRRFNVETTITTDDGTNITTEKTSNLSQMLFNLESLTSSYIFELKSMYRDYPNYNYNIKNNKSLTVFDNVIRRSDSNTDELYRNIYKFYAEDYYNIPTNRGCIVYIFSVLNNIYVHTTNMLFKFDGENKLNTIDKDVTLSENNLFDSGILEVFDSQYGYGGLSDKTHTLVTYRGYIFYDKVVNKIYVFDKNSGLLDISQPINKILNELKINDVIFAEDVVNDRFFVNIKSENDNNLCLSYSFISKGFSSIHDFDFTKAFNSRNNIYFTNDDLMYYKFNSGIMNYKTLYKRSVLFIQDMPNELEEDRTMSCVDIICNMDYEKIKVLNYINWVCSQINKYVEDNNLFIAEEDISKYPGTKIRIYSDQCSTDLIDLTDENGVPYEQNAQILTNPNSYTYPRYNCGIWSLNYFRDIRNTIILQQQDKSLIYGKYFVVRFIFKNKNFKLENINFNIQDYEKV